MCETQLGRNIVSPKVGFFSLEIIAVGLILCSLFTKPLLKHSSNLLTHFSNDVPCVDITAQDLVRAHHSLSAFDMRLERHRSTGLAGVSHWTRVSPFVMRLYAIFTALDVFFAALHAPQEEK